MQGWTPNAHGEAYLANNDLSKSMRHAARPMMVFRQFLTLEDGSFLKKGQSKLITRVSKVAASGYDATSTDMARTPETTVTFTQQTCTVYLRRMSIPWTGLLENVSQFDPNNVDAVALRDDMAETLNKLAAVPFTSCKLKYTPTGSTVSPEGTLVTGGTVSATATRHIQIWDMKQIKRTMGETYLIPKYDGKNYITIMPDFSLGQLFDEEEVQEGLRYGKPEALFAGEMKQYDGIRYMLDNSAMTSAMGGTSYYGEGVVFGHDAVVEVITKPEELRRKLSVDYGEDQGVGWFYTGGFAETQPVATARHVKIVHITSV